MNPEQKVIAGKSCKLYMADHPECLLIQPVSHFDAEELDREVSLIQESSDVPFMLCAFEVVDWNSELSPWDAPPVFGNEAFGHGAADTLVLIEKSLLPVLFAEQGIPDDIPVILGGYSLAGLFALWSACETGTFFCVTCVSPSVWFPGWMEYAEAHPVKSDVVYLSLGDREEKVRNPVMSRVGDCIRKQYKILNHADGKVNCVLEWNEGNHFREPEVRTAKGFSWCLSQIKKQERDSM